MNRLVLLLVTITISVSASGCLAATSPSKSPLSESTVTLFPSTVPPTQTTPLQTNTPSLWPSPGSNSLDDVVTQANLIVQGTITSLKYELPVQKKEDGLGLLVRTVYTLSVERVIKGDSNKKEVYIQKIGGIDPNTGNRLSVDAEEMYFERSSVLLVALKVDDYNTFASLPGTEIYRVLPHGVLWYKGIMVSSSETLDKAVGYVIVKMQSNNVLIALPQSEWPPLPVGPVTRPANSSRR